MNRSIIIAALAALTLGAAAPATAQDLAITTERRVDRLPTRQLAGPRVGFTSFTGDVAKLRELAGLKPVMTQFGWQFETQIVSLDSGHQALVELIHLVGGFGQGEVNVTAAVLLGLRTPNGFELGMGPSLSMNRDADKATTSMIVAVGATLPVGELYVPVNVAISLAEGGPRITTLFGWLTG